MSRYSDILIVGGGAAGLMCAAHLKKEFLILEKMGRAAGKLTISGGGRCNFTNESVFSSNYVAKEEFVSPIIERFSSQNMISLAKNWKIPFEVCKQRQLFCKHSSKEIMAPLLERTKGRIVLNTSVLSAKFEDGMFVVDTNRGEYRCANLIVASGGLSYPLLGASDIGYEIANGFGHSIVTPKPALVGLTVQPSEFWFRELSGISVDVIVRVGGKSFADSLLFAHKGISGPVVLNASLYWERGTINIDFLPNFEIGALLKGEKQVSTLLPLPKRFTKAFLSTIGVADKPAKMITKEEMLRLLRLKNYEFAPAGTFGFSKAEITKGGIATDDVEPNTMESRLQKGLYFIGEALDVNGELGGYNFHFAFASAVVCAEALNSKSPL